jgi:hypothetical protein
LHRVAFNRVVKVGPRLDKENTLDWKVGLARHAEVWPYSSYHEI